MLATCCLDRQTINKKKIQSFFIRKTGNETMDEEWWWSSSAALKCFKAPFAQNFVPPPWEQIPAADGQRTWSMENHLFRLNRFAFYYPTISHIHSSLSWIVRPELINWPSSPSTGEFGCLISPLSLSIEWMVNKYARITTGQASSPGEKGHV